MGNTSYIIQELNKIANSQSSFISKAAEGLNINLKTKLKLVKKLQSEQNNSSDDFGTFTEQVLPCFDKLSTSIQKIEANYGTNPSTGVTEVVSKLQKVKEGLSEVVTQTIEAEKVSDSNIVELSEILVDSLKSHTIPPVLPDFGNNFLFFIESGLSLQKRLVGEYSQSIRFTIDNGNKLIEEANFFINFYVSEQGSFIHGLEPTLRATNSLLEILNLFN